MALRQTQTVELDASDGQRLPVHLRRSKGTRHYRLRLNYRNEAVVSLPQRATLREAQAFLKSQRDWLEAQLRNCPPVRSLAEWFREHPYLCGSGDRFTVTLEQTGGSRASYHFGAGGALIRLLIPAAAEDPAAALAGLVRRFARDALQCRLAFQAQRLATMRPSLTVRDQASRWGSCSSKGAVSLNWRLVLLPPGLQDYVILHELAHLRELNHSASFWALLDRYDPDRRENEKALEALTPEVMRVER